MLYALENFRCVCGLKSGCSNLIPEGRQLMFYSAESYYDGWVSPEVVLVTFVICPVSPCVSLTLRRQTSPPLTHPFNCFKHLVKTNVTSPNQGSSIIWMVTRWIWKTTMSNNIYFSFCSHLTVGQCVCMCVLGVLVLGLFLYKNVIRRSFCFWKLYVNIVGEN